MLAKALQQAAGNSAAGDALYVEDVFQTYLYTGNGANLTVNDGVDYVDSVALHVRGDALTDLSPTTPKTLTPTNVATSASITKFQAQSLYFSNASSSKIAVSSAISLKGAYTIEMWLYRVGNSANYTILFGGISQSMIWQNDGTLWPFGYGIAAGGTVLNNSQWHHIAVVVEPGVSVRVYANGTLYSQNTSNTAYTTTVDQILNYTSDGYSMIGYVDEIIVSNYAKYSGSSFTVPSSPMDVTESAKGGLLWIKSRTTAHASRMTDSVRGATANIISSTSSASSNLGSIFGFNSNGFSLSNSDANTNTTSDKYAAWSLRQAPNFFDIVTYTGNGSSQSIAHNLGSTPGCIMIKSLNVGGNWRVYHVGTGLNNTLFLNLSNTVTANAQSFTAVSSTTFTVGSETEMNNNGDTYVAYVFAHNAGGFGEFGNEDIISCGTFTGATAGVQVTLGWEPQFVLYKCSSSAEWWGIADVMRGAIAGGSFNVLHPNTSDAEYTYTGVEPNATGFFAKGTAFTNGATYQYIAIRRPMKVPGSGSEVFIPVAYTGTDAANILSLGINTDLLMFKTRGATATRGVYDKMRGRAASLYFDSTGAELSNGSATTDLVSFGNTSVTVGSGNVTGINNSPQTYILHALRRATGFMDVVCYTGTGASTTVTHGLGVVPELIIRKCRSNAEIYDWRVWCKAASNTNTGQAFLNTTDQYFSGDSCFTEVPTSTTFKPINSTANTSTYTYVAYLFATLAGVSKVGSYTGTGTTLQIDCGFSAGARFVLIKRTDAAGDWYVWDTARGIIAGNDPYLLLNSTAAEVTGTDYIDPYAAGFEISSTAPAAINANGGTFIYLAIA